MRTLPRPIGPKERNSSLPAVNASAWLSARRPVNEILARVHQLYIVQCCLIVGVELQCLMKFGPRSFEVAAQHIRIAFVIEEPRGFALEFGCSPVGVICKIESAQAIVTRRQSDPRHHVIWRFFNGVLKILLRQAEVAVVESLGAQPHRLIGRVVLHIARILTCDRIGHWRWRQTGLVAPSGQRRRHDCQTEPDPRSQRRSRQKPHSSPSAFRRWIYPFFSLPSVRRQRPDSNPCPDDKDGPNAPIARRLGGQRGVVAHQIRCPTLPNCEGEEARGVQEPISRSNFKMTGRRTIIKITGKMPSANGTTILTGNSFAFFSASNILLERISSLNSRSVVATSPPSSTECRKTATKDEASSSPSRSANALKASTELLPARISAPINSMLWPSAGLRLLSRSRILSNDASTVRPAVTHTVNKSRRSGKVRRYSVICRDWR